jgi:hypothetical protein
MHNQGLLTKLFLAPTLIFLILITCVGPKKIPEKKKKKKKNPNLT